jgi:hypothetical protein
LTDGDAGQADRFAELGIVHTKIAIATAREILAGERLEAARTERHDVDLELERVRAALDALELEIERERMREHLEQVVDETRRKAAAEEELRGQGRPADERAALDGARLEVARELVGRAMVGLLTLRLLVAADAVIEERLLPTEGSVEAALDRLGKGDLAGVQQHTEVAGVEARRIWETLWTQVGDQGSDPAIAGIEKIVADAGLESRREELGVGVALGGSTKGGALDKRGRARARTLAEALGEEVRAGRVRVLVVAVERAVTGSQGASSKRTDERAETAAAALIEAGLPEDAVAHHGLGASTPLEVLLGGKGDRVAVLIVPIPVEK